MDNQHKKIAGYRDLDEMEVELMNKLKFQEAEILETLEEIGGMRQAQKDCLKEGGAVDLTMKQLNESHRCITTAKTNLQQGFMWGVRSVALPQPLKVLTTSNAINLDDLEKEIKETWAGGGSFAHNIVRMKLQQMDKYCKERAQRIYKELQEDGY